jgi:hypothetical protein
MQMGECGPSDNRPAITLTVYTLGWSSLLRILCEKVRDQ